MIKKISWIILILFFCFSNTSEAAKKKKPRFKPYYLVSAQASDFSSLVTQTRDKINSSDFKLVGDFSPYQKAHIFVLTHDKLLESAASSDFGGYGAAIRVAITETDKGVQLSYVNPVYMANVYHIPEVAEVSAGLESLFGESEPAGSKRGITKRSLKNYQYMMFMPEFDDHDKLGSFDSHQQALATVNHHLDAGTYKLTKVFQIAVPGKDEVLIGVSINEGLGADTVVMPLVDIGDFKHTAHLPYAILVSGDDVYSQAGKFRIALAFPDLTMGTFMDISDAPDAIKDTLKQLTTKTD